MPIPTNLEDAITAGDLNLVKERVAAGEDVNQKNQDGLDLLSHALDHLQVEIAQFLLDCGADVNGMGSVYPPLQAAIEGGAYEVIFSLIDKGANVNLKGPEEGNYPIHQLAWGYLDKVFFEKMVAAGADLSLKNNEGLTAYEIMKRNAGDNPEHETEIQEILKLLAV